jgi:hypothetical protein
MAPVAWWALSPEERMAKTLYLWETFAERGGRRPVDRVRDENEVVWSVLSEEKALR